MAATTVLEKVRSGVMVVGLAAGIVLGGFGFGSSAEAKAPTGPVDPALANICRGLQTLYNHEMNLSSTLAGGSRFNQSQHFRKAQNVKQQWIDAGCDEHYGSID